MPVKSIVGGGHMVRVLDWECLYASSGITVISDSRSAYHYHSCAIRVSSSSLVVVLWRSIT